MSFRFKAGTLQVSNAPIPSICRLICDQLLKSIKEDFTSLQSLCFSHLVLPRSDHAAPEVQTPHIGKLQGWGTGTVGVCQQRESRHIILVL